MPFRALVTIGDYDFPEPSTYSANTATVVDSGRNLQGVTIGSVIRDDIAKIEMSWKYLTVAQWSAINKLFKQSSGGRFYNTVTFFDQTEGTWVTREMYVSDRNGGMWRRHPIDGNVMGWTGAKLTLVEV